MALLAEELVEEWLNWVSIRAVFGGISYQALADFVQ